MDVFKIALGGLQATALMLRLRPDVILSKSGPTSLAVLLAGRLSGARLITYDSDAIAGLAHKLVGNWADLHLVGQSSGRYPYHDAKIEVVGVPINAVFDTPATPDEVAQAKQALDVTDKTLVFVFAGSLGSTAINQAIMAVAPHLPDTYQVILVAGHNHATKLAAQLKEAGLAARVSIKDYINGPEAIRQHYAAADVVVARAGATTTAEIAAMAKPAIIIPASQLSDQLVNAKQLAKNQAAIVLSDETITSQPNQLTEAINKLTQTDAGQHCAKQLHGLYVPQAAQKIAQHVIKSNG